MPRSLTPAPKRSLVAEVASALGTTEDTFAVATAIRRNINAPGYGALARPAVPQYPRVNRRGIYHDYHDYDASIEVPRFAPRAASAPTAGFGCEEVIGDNY